MKITLHGAAGEVTGSAYLVETDQARVLVDFGMFQGSSRLEAKNVLPSGLDPDRLDAVVVTHAHLDHTGRLPLLGKISYAKPIFATQPTIELTGLILRDSAKVQALDIERVNRRRARAGEPPLEPLYALPDVEAILPQFKPVEFGQPVAVAPGIRARYVSAGHMLGSASVELTVREEQREKVVVFSGDIGPRGLALIQDAVPFRQANLVFLESTYGDRDHKPFQETLKEFRAIIEDAIREKSRVLVPAFAVGRTQQILYHLDELFFGGRLTPFPVFIDSPMAIEATRIYERHPDLFDEEAQELNRGHDLASRRHHVKPTPTAQDSMALNDVPGPCLIMAGSGMCNAGRIQHHLKHGLWKPETVVIIVGYQGEGTLGRQLVDHAPEVSIFGEKVAVKAQIRTLGGFSAHAAQSELLKWFAHAAIAKPQVVLTHGEDRGRLPLAELIEKRHGLKAVLPRQGDIVRL
jgi:metallo-beta-lactamase family protein